MKKNKIFIACDSTNIQRIKEIIKKSKTSKLKIGYKFGLEFLNSKHGRKFVSQLKNQITFGDYKFSDIPNTCSSAIKAIKDLKFNYCTMHISSGLEALKAVKKVSGKNWKVGSIEREEFYTIAKKAYCIVSTSDARPFGCFILTKGVILPNGKVWK